MPYFFKLLFMVAAASLLVACNGKSEDTELTDENLDILEHPTVDSARISAQNVFNSIPARETVMKLSTESSSQYDPEFLNDPNAVGKYAVESRRALNLGVYGADLSTTGIYEQTQESMLYLKCVNILAKQLGVSGAFDEKMVDRMEANKQNRDSTLEIVSQSFKKADASLKQNGRPGTSALIVAGAWVEGMYIASKTAFVTKHEKVIDEIFKQQESLRYLLELLLQSKLDSESDYLLKDLTLLKESMSTSKSSSTEGLKAIFPQIESLRKKIIATH